MDVGVVLPLIVVALLVVGAIVWYRRSMDSMRRDDVKPVSGVRLTAEALHRLDSPPWRVVYEIGGALGGVDHVAVGPPGVIAVTTVVGDRPDPAQLLASTDPGQLTAEAAVERGPVDELARPSGVSCQLSALVYWGTASPQRRAHDEVAHGRHLVEGQRLAEWLDELTAARALDADADPDHSTPGTLSQSQIDLSWQAIVMGIGRPNPIP